MDCLDHRTVSAPRTDHFPSLPVEILEKIGYEALPIDLINMRLTCTTLSDAVFKPFVRGHFVERKHIFTEPSLRNLIDITEHPVFGLAIRVVKLGLSHMREAGLVPVFAMASSMNQTRGSALLALALQNLKRLGNTIEFGIFDCTNGDQMSREGDIRHGSATGQLAMLLQAANLSRYDVKVLTMKHVDHKRCEATNVGRFRAELSKIEELNFECNTCHGFSYGLPAADLLKYARPTKLRFQSGIATRNADMPRLGGSRAKFEELYLSDFSVDAESLVRRLGEHRASLRSLTLDNIELICLLSWDEVLQPLVNFPKLRSLRLSDLYANLYDEGGDPGIWQFDDYQGQRRSREDLGLDEMDDRAQCFCVLGDTHSFTGREEVRNGINSLIPRFKKNFSNPDEELVHAL